MAKEIEKPAGTTQATEETVEATTTTEETTEETTTTEEGTTTETDGAAEISIKSITRDSKGNFEWRVNPDDENSTVYKGKTLDELFQNAAQGIGEKDSFIKKLQADGGKVGPSRKFTGPEVEDGTGQKVDFPEYGQVLTDVANKAGVDIQMLTWSDEKWQELEQEKGTRAVLRMEDRVKQVKAQADAIFAEQNTEALNTYSLYEETEAVQNLLDEAKIPATDFDYDAILAKVHAEPNNFLKNGIRKNGRITAAVARAIAEIVTKRAKTEGRTETEEEIATARLKKGKAPAAPGRAAPTAAPRGVAPKNTKEALAQIKKEMGIT